MESHRPKEAHAFRAHLAAHCWHQATTKPVYALHTRPASAVSFAARAEPEPRRVDERGTFPSAAAARDATPAQARCSARPVGNMAQEIKPGKMGITMDAGAEVPGCGRHVDNDPPTETDHQRRVMAHIGFKRRIQMSTALLVSLACLGLAACGSSTKSSSFSSSAASAPSTSAAGTTATKSEQAPTAGPATIGAHQLYLRELLARCVRKNGIDLPEPNAEGQFDLKGINENSPRFKAAVSKCIATLPRGG